MLNESENRNLLIVCQSENECKNKRNNINLWKRNWKQKRCRSESVNSRENECESEN